jgi:HNH endonuclease
MRKLSRCILWPGACRKQDGRPVIGNRYVYRIVFEQLHGRLPTGMALHHLCDEPRCINPAHLIAVSQSDHMKLHGRGGDWGQRDKTHCPAGHPYDAANTYCYAGERHCKACQRAAKRRYLVNYRAKQKGL